MCFGTAIIITLTLCVVFGDILTSYYQPMEDVAYDLSMFSMEDSVPDDWVYDQKGWTVFTQEGETVTELTPDGYGGFSRLDEPGQTFYFSRVLTEELDSPVLCLDADVRTFAVFLDGALIYTDCPELDNRIGYLRLPTLESIRIENVLVKLPQSCVGKTLTIAQSTKSSFDESGGSGRVWPCAVTLYCRYAYESTFISESFQAAIPSTLSYAAGLVLLALFLLQAFQGRLDLGTLCGALAAFSYLTTRLGQTSFSHLYYNWELYFCHVPIDSAGLCRDLALLMLLVMLVRKLSGWRRIILGAVTAGLTAFSLMNFILAVIQQDAGILLIDWFFRMGATALLLALAFGFLEWNRRQWFFRLFCPLTLAGIVLYVIPTVNGRNSPIWSFYMFLSPLLGVFMPTAFLSTVAEWLHGELARQTRASLLAQRGELAQRNYEVLRRQHEQVMMLRHDMVKHFRLLRQTTGDEKTAAYLDELIGENEKIRPVVQSGNEVLDVILNEKLSAAADAGIQVELVRTQAPNKLPLSEAELCSLMMNILDNAVEAAAAPGVERPHIKLDLCVKEHFFVLFCENSATLEYIQKETAPERGLGLKIIKQIAARYDNLLETEYDAGYYRVKLAIPLD